jgi:hypothetical protein
MDVACVDCHREIAWLEQKDRGLHARVENQDCSECHPEHAGREFELIEFDSNEAAKFRHEDAGWPLEGKHAAVKCESCHRTEFARSPAKSQRSADAATPSYLGLEQSCQYCHVDDHDKALGIACENCHDMNGFKPAPLFDHAKTSYPLVGAHQRVVCTKCHAQTEPNGKSMIFPVRDTKQCSSCHNDPHKGRLGPLCSDCHNEADWNSNLGANFDHTRTRFALRGAHARTPCAKCHDKESAWGDRPAFANCADCHADPHLVGKRSFDGDCSRCHGESQFKPATFDTAAHAKTRFSLEGAHRNAACSKCHVELELGAARDSKGMWWRDVELGCGNCHTGAHGDALAALRSASAECLSCHNQSKWSPSSFDGTAHEATRFALKQKHAASTCNRCHAVERADLPAPPQASSAGKAGLVFALEQQRCADCHANPHGDAKTTQDCEKCHDSQKWSPTSIGIKEHERFAFRLDGSHAAVPCVECHDSLGASVGGSNLLLSPVESSIRFGSKPRDCRDCHLAGIPGQKG